jgi:hypothetical protein
MWLSDYQYNILSCCHSLLGPLLLLFGPLGIDVMLVVPDVTQMSMQVVGPLLSVCKVAKRDTALACCVHIVLVSS